MFQSGTLWDKVTRTTDQAWKCGALLPIPTALEVVPNEGIDFLVRIVANLARKMRSAPSARGPAETTNPFLPYDEALYVADASESHVCLLNKFNVVDHHLLIVTRRFEPQLAPLNLDDFAAIWRCLAEYEGLVFYNAGQVAGASQPHKHLQMVPLPMSPQGPAVPIEPLIEGSPPSGPVGRISGFPFPHVLARLEAGLALRPDHAARLTLSLYRAMLPSISLTADTLATGAYNLLLTRRWMLLVPRYRETVQTVSLNSLAFAGALLVRDQQQLSQLKDHGLLAALTHAATRPGPSPNPSPS